jgi:hypothetical protein
MSNEYRPMLPVDYKVMIQYAPQTAADVPANAAYTLPGFASTITPDYTAQHQDDAIFGKYDLHSSTHTGRLNRLTLNYAPFDITMIERGMLLPNGAGTAEEYLTFIESTLIDGDEMFRLHVGSIITSQSGQINRGSFRMTHVYEVADVSDWVLNHGLTSYNFVTFGEIPTDPAWSHLVAGEDPCEIDGVIVDVSDFRWDINWPLARLEPNGYFSFKYARQSARRIGLSITSWLKDNVLKNYVKDYTEQDVDYTIKSGAGPDYILHFLRCKFDRYTQSAQAGGNAFATETISGICLGGVTIETAA